MNPALSGLLALSLWVPALVVMTSDFAAADERRHTARATAATLGVPVPAGTRADRDEPGLMHSRRGFRRTVAFYRKHFKRRGEDVRRVPTYQYRGVTVARFVARSPDTRWQAVHVFRHRGRTFIRVVARGSGKPVHNTP